MDQREKRIIFHTMQSYGKTSRPQTCELSIMHAGPAFGQNIMDILLRFCLFRVAVTADVEKALMVSVAEDRDAL